MGSDPSPWARMTCGRDHSAWATSASASISRRPVRRWKLSAINIRREPACALNGSFAPDSADEATVVMFRYLGCPGSRYTSDPNLLRSRSRRIWLIRVRRYTSGPSVPTPAYWIASIQFQHHRAVIGAINVVKNFRLAQPVLQRRRGQKVIQPPANIPGACAAAHAPPTVFHCVRVEVAERVDIIGIQQPVQAVDLALSITGALVVVGLGARDINGPMTHIEITTHDNRLALLQMLNILAKRMVPLLTIIQPTQPFAGVGRIDRYQKQVIKLRRNDAAFLVMLVQSEPRADFVGRGAAKHRGA